MRAQKELPGFNKLKNRDVNNPIPDLIVLIEGFRKLENDWDTYGAEKISGNSISTAIQLINTFRKNNIIIDRAFPMRDGGVQLEKDFAKNCMEIEISPDMEITFLVFDRSENLVFEKICNGFELKDIINIINDKYGNIHYSGKR